MNSTLYVVLLTLVLGCSGGEKEKSESPSQSENTQQEENQNTNEVANKLFDEAMQLIRDGESAGADFHTAGHYEKALDKIHKIVKEYPESDIGRKVISNQKLFIGKSLAQFEGHVKEVREGSRDLNVTLPTNSSGKTLSTTPKVIVINVKQDGSYMVGAQGMNLEQIAQLLKEAVEQNASQRVLLRVDGEAQFKRVSAALNAARSVGIPRANIGYQAYPQ
jgi:biopolymer transport protein ExbD